MRALLLRNKIKSKNSAIIIRASVYHAAPAPTQNTIFHHEMGCFWNQPTNEQNKKVGNNNERNSPENAKIQQQRNGKSGKRAIQQTKKKKK